MVYNPNDFNFGASPTLSADGMSVSIPNYGASNPTGAYLQSMTPTTGAIGATGKTGVGGFLDGSGLGFNLDTGKLVLGGLQTIGSLWQAWEANKLAKEQFKFSKDFALANLGNSIQSYNTTLEDRGRARAFTESQTPDQAAAYIADNRLPDAKIK